MIRRVVYIAAPYGARSIAARRVNVARAVTLAAWAVRQGLSPVVVHAWIDRVHGADDDPRARAVGMECDLAIVDTIARGGGELWVVLRPDGSMSPGVSDEVDRWHSRAGFPPRMMTWAEWMREMDRG